MTLKYEFDIHVPVEDILDGIQQELEKAGCPMTWEELFPKAFTLDEALNFKVGDVLSYEVTIPTKLRGNNTLEIVAVVTQRSFENKLFDTDTIFRLVIRPEMFVPCGPITEFIGEYSCTPWDEHAKVCDVILLNDDGAVNPEVRTEMEMAHLPQKGSLLFLPTSYVEDLTGKVHSPRAKAGHSFDRQLSYIQDPICTDFSGTTFTVIEVRYSYSGRRSEVWISALE